MVFVQPEDYKPLLRIYNTNVDGNENCVLAMTRIKGVGRRFANIVLKKAEVDLTKRAGELTDAEIEKVQHVINNPLKYDIPRWMLNRQKDVRDGKDMQIVSNVLDGKLRDDLIRLKKMRAHRGLRHHWNVRVRGQRTKTTGRHGNAVGVSKKKN